MIRLLKQTTAKTLALTPSKGTCPPRSRRPPFVVRHFHALWWYFWSRLLQKNISFFSGLFLRVRVLQEVDDLPLLSGYRFFMICDETSEADYCKKNISFFSGLFLRGHVLQEVDGHPFVVPTIDSSCSSDDTSEADYRIILGFCTLPTIEQHNQQKLGMPFKNNNLRVSLVV